MNRWYVVHTHPQAEERAVHHLQFQGFSVYLPRFRAERRHARKVEIVERPLFPRYLFIDMDVEQTRWRSIRGTFGVRDLVSRGDRPAPVPMGVVEEIRRREGEDGLIKLPIPSFQTGERVQVTDGALAEQIGVVLAMPDHQRVILLLGMLGREVQVTVPATSLRAYA